MNKTMKKTINPAESVSILPKVAKPQSTPIDRIKNWWRNHFGTKEARKSTGQTIACSVDSGIRRFSKALRFNLVLALVAMLVLEFCPEISEKCPTFFQLCEGILVFYEFLLRAVFTALKAMIQLFTLNYSGAADSLSAVYGEAGRLIAELINWVQAITF